MNIGHLETHDRNQNLSKETNDFVRCHIVGVDRGKKREQGGDVEQAIELNSLWSDASTLQRLQTRVPLHQPWRQEASQRETRRERGDRQNGGILQAGPFDRSSTERTRL